MLRCDLSVEDEHADERGKEHQQHQPKSRLQLYAQLTVVPKTQHETSLNRRGHQRVGDARRTTGGIHVYYVSSKIESSFTLVGSDHTFRRVELNA